MKYEALIDRAFNGGMSKSSDEFQLIKQYICASTYFNNRYVLDGQDKNEDYIYYRLKKDKRCKK